MPKVRPPDSSRPVAPEDRPTSLGTALSHKAFRRVFAGTLASNIGTWMQNITLGVLAYNLTGEAWFIGVITFAQLGPMLVLSPVGGAIADRVDRRVLMVSIAATQLVFASILAVVALADEPSKVLLVALVAAIGIGNALNGPAANATLPDLVPRHDLRSAVALNSGGMNSARVFGPILGGLLNSLGGASLVFLVNGATYLFVIVALCSVHADFRPKHQDPAGPLHQIREGLSAVHADQVIERILITIAVMSMFSLVFIYQMPKLAEEQLGLAGWHYNLLFATFGLGAAIGALAMGSVLSHVDRPKATRFGLAVLGIALAIFSTTSLPAVAFPAVFVLGASYFVVVTALITMLQLRVDDRVRGRVMGLWMMAWAGLVPVGGLLAGPFIDWLGMEAVLLFGAGVAIALAILVDLREPGGAALSSLEVRHTAEADEATDLALGETIL